MVGKSKFLRSFTSINSFLIRTRLLQIFIILFLITIGSSCPDGQYLITYYLQSDMVTQANPLSTCLSIADYGNDAGCLSYYLNSTTNLYSCIQCYSPTTFSIQLDSGRNFCGFSQFALYNYDCAVYADKNPQFFYLDVQITLYQCKTCKDPKSNLISVQHFIYDLLLNNQIDVNLFNTLCTQLPLISGKVGGQECLIYESTSFEYNPNTMTNNLYNLACAKCKTAAVSMDCSFACGANEYEIKYFSNGFITSICISAGGIRSWDNYYMSGYTYGCPLYASYDSVNNILGNCVTNVISNCLQYDPLTKLKCLKCPQHYYLNYQSNLCIQSVLLCASYLGSVCTQCIQPYSLANQTCVIPSPPNCDAYNLGSGNCSKCKNQYFLNSLMNCDPYKLCFKYQYLNTSINQCQDGQIQNCLTYFNDGIQCSQCESNYQIDSLGFSCKYVPPAVICPNNTDKIKYEIFSRKCVQVDINCKYYLESGYCYQCLDRYYSFNGSCYSNSQTTNSTFPPTKISNN